MTRKTTAVLVAVAALVAVPAAGGRHVTVNPSTAQAGSFARFDVRVPNEAESASTVKVSMQLPAGLKFARSSRSPAGNELSRCSGSRSP